MGCGECRAGRPAFARNMTLGVRKDSLGRILFFLRSSIPSPGHPDLAWHLTENRLALTSDIGAAATMARYGHFRVPAILVVNARIGRLPDSRPASQCRECFPQGVREYADRAREMISRISSAKCPKSAKTAHLDRQISQPNS